MLLSFWVFMIALVIVGFIKKSSNTPFGFYLGNKQADKFVSGISAQTSGFGGYVFLTLPGLIYAYGANKAWVAAGLFIGTIITWIVIPDRLRKYSNRNEKIYTIPEYFNYRFGCKNKCLKFFSAFLIFSLLTVMSICSFVLVGRVLSSITNLSYGSSLIICLFVVLIYIVLGGYSAVCLTDYIQGLLMLIGIFSISIVAIMLMGKEYIVPNIYHSGINSTVMEFLNVFEKDGNRIPVTDIVSQMCVGLGICGLPQVAVRFMGVKNSKTLVKSRRIAVVWGLGILTFSCIAGVIGRAYLYPIVLDTKDAQYEYVYVEMIKKAFEHDINTPFVTGILLCSALAAIMAALDSQILSASSAVADDILCNSLFANVSEKNRVLIGRLAVICIGVVGCLCAFFIKINVNEILENCWACLACTFGPTLIMSLYWKRMNGKGAFCGMLVGLVMQFIWGYIAVLGNVFTTIIVSLVTKPIAVDKIKEYENIVTYRGE